MARCGNARSGEAEQRYARQGLFMNNLRRAAEIAKEFIASLPYTDEGRQVHEILVEALDEEGTMNERLSEAK